MKAALEFLQGGFLCVEPQGVILISSEETPSARRGGACPLRRHVFVFMSYGHMHTI